MDMLDLKHQFDALTEALKQLESHVLESDFALPARSIETAKPALVRQAALPHILDLERDEGHPRGYQAILCAKPATAELLSEINQLKDRFKEMVQQLKQEKGVATTQFNKMMMRHPGIAERLRHLGLSQLDLLKVYRHIPACRADRLPDAVAYAWTSGNRSSERLTSQEVLSVIQSSSLSESLKVVYFDVVKRIASGRQARFIRSRSLVLHPIMNLRFPGEAKWTMIRSGVPIFIESDRLPLIKFTPKPSEDETIPARIRRRDAQFDDVHDLVLPALNIYQVRS